jgi:hypothetical protein
MAGSAFPRLAWSNLAAQSAEQIGLATTTLRQTVTPSLLLGRVSAINIATYGSRPLAAAVGAPVGGLHGAETGLLVAAAGFLI